MFLAVQPNLAERAVFEAVRNDATIRPHYERQFADCFEHREGRARDEAFSALHDRWFNELGFRDRIVQLVREFPNFHDHVERMTVIQSRGPRAQTVELFGAAGRFTVAMAVAPAVLVDPIAFAAWARHEFMHVDDMLDPAFGFDLAQKPSG